MTVQHSTRPSGVLGALLMVAVGLAFQLPLAEAATRTVTLGPQGPSPATITIAKGDVVKFVNNDNVPHTEKSSSANWSFNKGLVAGASASTPAFTSSGTFTYNDTFTLVAVPRTIGGSIVVPGSAASPSASPTSSASPRPSPTASRTSSPSPRASTSASPTPHPSQTGTAIGPGLGVGGLPSVPPATATTGPRPNVAPPAPSSSAAGAVSYGRASGVVQGSAHRYGLPAALALVAITGVLSLLVRLLLAHPAAARVRRPTGSVGDPGNGEA